MTYDVEMPRLGSNLNLIKWNESMESYGEKIASERKNERLRERLRLRF